ncbi:g6264 [Coccomyxa elongata]
MADLNAYDEEELTDLEWARRAPDLEPGCFLRKEDGSNVIDPRGVALAFVKEGYFAQCDAVGLLREEPQWTSLALRRSQSLHFTNLKRFSRLGAPPARKLGLVEMCTVVSATYHRRILPEDTVEFCPQRHTQHQQQGLQGAALAAGALQPADLSRPNGSTSLPVPHSDAQASTAEVWSQHPPEAVARAVTPEGEVPDPPVLDSDSEAGVSATVHRRRGQFFIRLVLKRDGIRSYTKTPLTTAIDFYVDSGTGEWLIPRARYDEAQKRQWRRGNRFKMFWDAPETPGVGMWWHGVVRGRVQRDRFDPLRNSPWEALRVRWDSGGQETMVSMWEIQQEEESLWLPQALGTELYVVSDDEAEWQPDWRSSDSEDESEGQRRKRRRQPRQLVLPGEVETEQHLRDPARRQRRGGSSQPRERQVQASRSSGSLDQQLPEAYRPPLPLPRAPNGRPPLTMQRPSQRNLKMDWNSIFCTRCGDGGVLLECDGTCLRSFHADCLTPNERPGPDDPPGAPWYCPDCRLGIGACAICKQTGVVGQHILKCKMGSCGYYFHNTCLNGIRESGCLKIHREDPAVARGGQGERVFTCPAHFCHVCRVSGDAQRMLRCWRCPTAYHSRCLPQGLRRLSSKNVECLTCSHMSLASRTPASVLTLSLTPTPLRTAIPVPIPTSNSQHAVGPSIRPTIPNGDNQRLIERKRQRKPDKAGGNGSRAGASSSGGSRPQPQPQPSRQPQAQPQLSLHGQPSVAPQIPPTVAKVQPQPSVAAQQSMDMAQRPTRLALLEAKIMEDAAVEEALGCIGRIVPLEGNSPAKDLIGKSVFTFGTQKKGDFYVPADRIKVHSQLTVHPSGRITIGFCNAQARERYPITIIHAEGDPTTLTNMQSVPLRHQDVLSIADACFIFERVGIEEALAGR